MQVRGMIALVTGGASGLGRATARALAGAGARVAVLDLDDASVRTVADEVGGLALACDVSDDDQVETALAEARDELGTVRINVNCAGVAGSMLLVDKNGPVDMDRYRKVIDINLLGTVSVMSKCAAQMMAETPLNEDGEHGVIINTASIAAYEGMIGQCAYAASKGAIASLCLPAAREFGPRGVRVVTIAPGLFDTTMANELPKKTLEAMHRKAVFPERFGKPEEFADMVLSVCKNPIYNGATLRLDGAIRL